jgi:hypothetical protein
VSLKRIPRPVISFVTVIAMSVGFGATSLGLPQAAHASADQPTQDVEARQVE